MTTKSLITAVSTLTDTVDSARTQGDRARALDLDMMYVDEMHDLALALDAARTRLVQDGEEYLGATWQLLDRARERIVNIMLIADRRARLLAVGS